MKGMLSGLLLLMVNFSAFAGYDIVQVDEVKQNGKSIVQEVFYYACEHCKEIESKVLDWKKNLNNNTIVEKIPVILSDKQYMAAKHYYAAVYLNVEEEFSINYFNEISNNKEISDSLAKSILINLGEKSEKIEAAFNSHWVGEKIEEAKKITLKLKVAAVPVFLVNNKYLLKRSDYKNDDELFLELSELVK